MEPHPGPSNIVSTACAPQELVRNDTDTDSEDECEITEEEKCCVCHKFTPDAIRQSVSIIFTKWVSCDNCPHWVHLAYCTPRRVVRRGDTYLCPHCDLNEE